MRSDRNQHRASLAMGFVVLAALRASSQSHSTRPKDVTDVVRASSPAVVLIVTQDASGEALAQGSGFIVSPDGKVVTNYHVIEGTDSAMVKMSNGGLFPVEGVLAKGKADDLAVLKISGRGLPVLRLGNPKTLSPGDRVIAEGSPLGLEGTVTDGIVSAIRSVASSASTIQTTAAISHGSSGGSGPLLNLSGEVVGVLSFKLSGGENLNFAVAVSALKPLLSATGTPEALSALKSPVPAENTTMPTASTLTGGYRGIVQNTTVDKSADFGIVIGQDEQAVYGCMVVSRPLIGSGALHGVTDGSHISFDVTGPVYTINFSGLVTGDDIAGSYSIPPISGMGRQQGVFTLHRVTAQGMPKSVDLQNCPGDAQEAPAEQSAVPSSQPELPRSGNELPDSEVAKLTGRTLIDPNGNLAVDLYNG